MLRSYIKYHAAVRNADFKTRDRERLMILEIVVDPFLPKPRTLVSSLLRIVNRYSVGIQAVRLRHSRHPNPVSNHNVALLHSKTPFFWSSPVLAKMSFLACTSSGEEAEKFPANRKLTYQVRMTSAACSRSSS